MKIKNGVNPEFADHDEIDQDALDAIHEFNQGILSFDELACQIGPEAAAEMRARFYDDEPSLPDLFDDPYDF